VGSTERYQIRVMVDASAFLQDLRLYVRRLQESILTSGFYATNEEIWVTTQLQGLIEEIESGYATLTSTGSLRPAQEARVGQTESQPDSRGPGECR